MLTRNVTRIWAPILVLFAGCVRSDAQPDTASLVEQRADDIAMILRNYEWGTPIVRPEHAATCEAVTNALSERAGIEFVEPVLVTNDPGHPRLSAYQERCRDYKGWPPGVENSDAAYRSLGDVGDEYFELYELYASENGAESAHELLYTKTTVESQRSGLANLRGGFYAIDLNQCVISAGVPRPGSDIGFTTPSQFPHDVSVLVKLEDRYYVINVQDILHQSRKSPEVPPLYSFEVWQDDTEGVFRSVCGIQTEIENE